MKFFSHLIETIRYIRTYGYSEWRKARERYDRLHVNKRDSQYSKVGEIKQVNKIKKAGK